MYQKVMHIQSDHFGQYLKDTLKNEAEISGRYVSWENAPLKISVLFVQALQDNGMNVHDALRVTFLVEYIFWQFNLWSGKKCAAT